MNSRLVSVVLAALALAGCAVDELDGPLASEGAAVSLQLGTGEGEAPAACVSTAHLVAGDVAEVSGGCGLIANNSLPPNDLANNALTGNRQALVKVIEQPLSSATYTGVSTHPDAAFLRQQLENVAARKVMGYLVGCALPAGAEVKWTSPRHPTEETFKGEYGLCRNMGWETGAAPLACQELVSACLLARVNSWRTTIPLRLVGEPTSQFAEPPPPPGTSRPIGMQPFMTYVPCDGSNSATQNGRAESRNCGWKAGYVGTCTPGETVTVSAGAPASGCGGTDVLGSTTGDTMLRVCQGLSYCSDWHPPTNPDPSQGLQIQNPDLAGQNDDACPPNRAPRVTFTCWTEGRFSVMTSSYRIGDEAAVAIPAARGTMPGFTYPADTRQVFDKREGGFFGNMFRADSLPDNWLDITVEYVGFGAVPYTNHDNQVIEGTPVFRHLNACLSPGNTEEDFKNRICIPSGSKRLNCAANIVGPCRDSQQPGTGVGACELDDGPEVPGNLDYQRCRGAGAQSPTWQNVVTSFLHLRCASMNRCGARPR
jgi:hypothetical protein